MVIDFEVYISDLNSIRLDLSVQEQAQGFLQFSNVLYSIQMLSISIWCLLFFVTESQLTNLYCITKQSKETNCKDSLCPRSGAMLCSPPVYLLFVDRSSHFAQL